MVIRNAKAFLNGAFSDPVDIACENGRITAIGKTIPGEDGIDLKGDYLLPGFVDVHIHAFKGQDTMNGEEAVRHMSRELRKAGVAAFLPTTMSAGPEDTVKALAGIRAVMENPEKDGAVVLGAHMEAPFLEPAKCGAQRKEFFVAPTIKNWETYTGEQADIVRMITMAPELPGAFEMIRSLTAKGITVSMGHTAADAAAVHGAAEQGATQITHTFNASTPLASRAPGVPGAALVDDRISCQFIGDGVHLHPDIVRLITRCKGAAGSIAITDAMEAAGMPDGTYALGGLDVFVRNGEARLKDGTLAGSTLTMERAFTNLIRFGTKPEDAAAMVTETPAKSIGNTEYGVIRVGAPAIFARFDSDFRFVEAL